MDYIPFPSDLFLENFLRPFWMTPGYVTPVGAKNGYFLQENGHACSHYYLFEVLSKKGLYS